MNQSSKKSFFDEISNLGQTTPVAMGKHKLVYEHPLDRDFLLKVINPVYTHSYSHEKFWFRQMHRERYYHIFVREIKEQLAMRVFNTRECSFVSPILGLVDTDLGVAQLVRAVRAADGSLAPTLQDLISRRQFDQNLLAALDQLLDWYGQSEVLISDLRPRNMVLTQEQRIIMIDGIGNKNTIPLRHIRFVNRLKNRRKALQVRAKILRMAEQSDFHHIPSPIPDIR